MKVALNQRIHRRRGAPLGLLELTSIALGGMIGGGIFTVLGVSATIIGIYTPIAIFLGGLIASLAAYSYIQLGVYFKDEGATYSFYKKVFPKHPFAASLIGWWVIFGYISTVALYAYTFSSYAISGFDFSNEELARKLFAGGVISFFALINIWSVKGMGKIEDLMVYTKLIILVIISFVLINNSKTTFPKLCMQYCDQFSFLGILIVSSITFVAYEGFQLVINAVNEMKKPEKNIPRSIYLAIFLAISIYVIIAIGAFLAIPLNEIVENKEHALAAGAEGILGHIGKKLVITGAILATSSAISGTLFGASRQMAIISEDGYFPKYLSKRKKHIPIAAIITMAILAFLLILSGGLQLILEFGSITFLLVSFLMAFANHKIRKKTKSSSFLTYLSMFTLLMGIFFIFSYEVIHKVDQIFFIFLIYFLLTISALIYAKQKNKAFTP